MPQLVKDHVLDSPLTVRLPMSAQRFPPTHDAINAANKVSPTAAKRPGHTAACAVATSERWERRCTCRWGSGTGSRT